METNNLPHRTAQHVGYEPYMIRQSLIKKLFFLHIDLGLTVPMQPSNALYAASGVHLYAINQMERASSSLIGSSRKILSNV